jgi:NAD(P)-dependent dehydrogenase (short-subunit alcohol dehydrogenase family)
MKILVTGTNRGIGLEFCRQLLGQEFGIQTLVAKVSDPSKAGELQALASRSQNRLTSWPSTWPTMTPNAPSPPKDSQGLPGPHV